MPSSREIRSQIGSIKNTQKITKAMELVAASKMRKAQLRMAASRPYAKKIRQVISHVAASHTQFQHAFLTQRETVKRVGYIVISSDRGLCGSLNINLFKSVITSMREQTQLGREIDLCLVGQKAENFFRRFGGNVVAQAANLGDTPQINDLVGIVKVMLDAYSAQKLDVIYLCFNHFVNTMSQAPTIEKLLPIEISAEETNSVGYWDYIYEPDSRALMDLLLVRYIETQVYHAVVENLACEQASRMVAMKNATDNAGQLIDDLQLAYNKARQASITREIAEITAGAEALTD